MAQTKLEQLDTIWWNLVAGMIFFGLIGLTLIESAMSRASHRQGVPLKNVIQLGIGAIAWWAIGYGLAFGDVGETDAVGQENFGGDDWYDSTIVSRAVTNGFIGISVLFISNGAISERTQLSYYYISAFVFMLIAWPIAVAWSWGGGWLSDLDIRFRDLGGCTTVHVFAGTIALVGVLLVKKRYGRWERDIEVPPFTGYDNINLLMGTIFYFVHLCFLSALRSTTWRERGTAVFNTALAGGVAAGIACVAGTAQKQEIEKHFIMLCRGLVAGCVAVSSLAENVEAWEAFVVGAIGGIVYLVGYTVLRKLQVDDSCFVLPAHLFPGIVGTILVGLFDNKVGAFHWGTGESIGSQLAGLVTIMGWAAVWALLIFGVMSATKIIRISDGVQKRGMNYCSVSFASYYLPGEEQERGDNSGRRT